MPRQFDYRMLIVDDDAVFCEIADELFSSQGYTVRCADDGFEALAMMKQALPDIIICDLNLPKMSGFELLSIIRRRLWRRSRRLRSVAGRCVAAQSFWASGHAGRCGSVDSRLLVPELSRRARECGTA